MRNSKLKRLIPILSLILYSFMIVINGLANILPINNRTTGEISMTYYNLFTPSSMTFSIWGVIYLLLTVFTVYQFIIYFKADDRLKKSIYYIGKYYIISSIANIFWILSWHYNIIPLSMLFMILILVSLIKINNYFKNNNMTFSAQILVKLPFEVYFSWITIATIANFIVLIKYLNITIYKEYEIAFTIIFILIGLLVAIFNTLRYNSIPYALVVLWAYTGIISKHLSVSGFNKSYPSIIITTAISMLLIIFSMIFLLRKDFIDN